MKKNEKIMIGILSLILVVIIGISIFNKVKIKNQDIWIDKNNPVSNNETNNSGDIPKEVGKIIKVRGMLYYDTGEFSENVPRCGTMDGNITSTVAEGQIPTEDNQANFEGVKGYQYARENTIEIPTDEGWRIFKAETYSFCGTIKQVEQNLFFVEPDEGEEIRQSGDKIIIEKLQLDTNVKFEIGEHIRIIYDGYVMETYPLQIRAISYETLERN